MKNDDKTTRSEWLDIVERYFDATTTIEEEKALAAFLATDESDSPEFNDIKAVMGYLSTGRSIARSKKRRTLGKATQWASIAACAAVIALIGTSINKNETQATDRDFYMACIDGKEYNDKELALNQMHHAMAMICSTTRGNDIEEQLSSFFTMTDNK